jgi:hypothetical protein
MLPTLNPQPSALNPQPSTLNLNLQPQTVNPQTSYTGIITSASLRGTRKVTSSTGKYVMSVTAPTAGGTNYAAGQATITCTAPCTGTGLVVNCVVADAATGAVTGFTVVSGGSGYASDNVPGITCPNKAGQTGAGLQPATAVFVFGLDVTVETEINSVAASDGYVINNAHKVP